MKKILPDLVRQTNCFLYANAILKDIHDEVGISQQKVRKCAT